MLRSQDTSSGILTEESGYVALRCCSCLQLLFLEIQEQSYRQLLGQSLSIFVAEESYRFGAFASHLMTKSGSGIRNVALQLRIR